MSTAAPRRITSLNRHLLLLVLSALVPVLVVGTVLAIVLVQQERRATERGLQESTRLLAQAVDAELQRSFAALQALSRSDTLRNDDLRSFYSEAKDVRDAIGLWDNVLLLSPTAEHLLNLSRPYGEPLPPVPQPEGTLTAARTMKPFVSNVLRGRVETHWLMYVASPVVADGVTRYVIGATMSHSYWTRWLAERTPADTIASILDRDNVVLARTVDTDKFVGRPIPEWYSRALQSPTGLVRGPNFVGEEVVASFHRSALSGWTVNLATPARVVDAPMRRVAVLATLALAVALSIAVALALRRAQVLGSGIRSLKSALELLPTERRLPPLDSPVEELAAAMDAAHRSAEVLGARAEGLDRAQQAARLGLWQYDPVTRDVSWSAGVYSLVGVPPDGVSTNEWWDQRLHPDDRERVHRRFAEIAERGGEFGEEFRIVRADGRVVWLACIGSTEGDEGGRPARMLGVNIDITRRKDAEALLRQSESKFRTISHAAPAFVWVTDPQGQLTFVNDRWTAYTGQSLDQTRGAGWTAATHPADVERLLVHWRRCCVTGEPYEGECRYRNRDGEYRWHLFRALPVRTADGRIEQWVGCAVDIHDAREAREALREADRRKDEFLATLAHELRNPLAPIRNAVQIIKLRNTEDEAIRSAQAMMERQVVQMVRLIDDLLDVSRISRGRLELKREPVELARIVDQAIETSRGGIAQRLTVSLPSEDLFIDGDALRLAQVLSNLLNNAAKYTDASGAIWLSARREGREVAISVRDNGIGIAADQLPRIFEMFTQARSAIHRSQGGLGIGLALARSLVELHDGTIEARSEGPGRGSEFIVRLPLIESPASGGTQEHAPAAAYQGPARRVLVVDDVEDNVRSLVALLRHDGHVVESAGDGLEAVAKAESFKPDLVLLDLGLPKLSGLEACRLMRSKPWGRGLVIVALSGWGQPHDRHETADAGFDDHLVKPVAYEALRDLLASPAMG